MVKCKMITSTGPVMPSTSLTVVLNLELSRAPSSLGATSSEDLGASLTEPERTVL